MIGICNKTIMLIFTVIFGGFGCKGGGNESALEGYSITIPDDVPEEIELIDKDGTRHQGNGRELYSEGHKHGWMNCFSEFKKGRIDLKNEFAYENFMHQHYWIWARGFKEGFISCQNRLLENAEQK